jgi:uncharacterized protein DUF6912
MRVYLPSTIPALAELLRTGEIGPAPVHGFAVTPALREWYSSGDVEELEYVALMHAARDSLRLLATDPLAPPRRVVLAAELTNGLVGGQEIGPDDPALVKIGSPVPLRDVVSAHIDEPSATEAIGAAVAALPAADAGDYDARFVVDGAEGYELLWFATQEIADLLA